MPLAFPAIVFDLDGTLIDSVPGISSALSAAFTAAGRTMPVVDLRSIIGPPIRVIARRLDSTLTDDELDILEPAYRALYDTSAWRDTVLFPTVADTLHTLRSRGHRLYIVTNKPRLPSVRILDHLRLADLFEEVVTRDTTTPPAPSKSAMLADMRQRNALNGSTLMVGDTAEDLEAATDNQLPFAFAAYGYGHVPSARLSLDHLAALLTFDFEVPLLQ